MDADMKPLWWVTTMTPREVTPEMLGCASHVRQCRILGRATTRAEFARKIIDAGLDCRSVAAVSAWVHTWGSTSGNAQDLAAVTDERIYLISVEYRSDRTYVAYPLETQS